MDLLAQEIQFKSRSEIESLTSPDLVSPFVLELPASVLRQAQTAVDAFFSWRTHPESQSHFKGEAAKLGLADPGNYSICMSYDFHLNSDGHLKLIEINTNAAFQGMGWLMYQAAEVPWPIDDYTPLELNKNIEEEIKRADLRGHGKSWVIMDERPFEQKLRIEFDYFLSLFRKWGKEARICDLQDVNDKDIFVYNRYTDFYFQEEKSRSLRELYLQKQTCFSPQPYEYLCLADKSRMVELSLNPELYRSRLHSDLSDSLESVLLRCSLLNAENAEDLWGKRRSLFFKPLRAYGGKQSYRGSSISRRHFDELIGQEILAQEYVPAPELRLETPEGPQDFKYDLRFYAYKGRVQGALARIYQGQLTNLKTKYGGFTPVRFLSEDV